MALPRSAPVAVDGSGVGGERRADIAILRKSAENLNLTEYLFVIITLGMVVMIHDGSHRLGTNSTATLVSRVKHECRTA